MLGGLEFSGQGPEKGVQVFLRKAAAAYWTSLFWTSVAALPKFTSHLRAPQDQFRV